MTNSSPSRLVNLLQSLLFIAIVTVQAQAQIQSQGNATSQTDSAITTTTTSTADCVRFSKTGLWDIDIDNKPALPPHCQPPFSRNADRNPDHLPTQIAAIAGSYVAAVVGVGIALLSLRRRRRGLLAPDSAMVELKLVNNESRKFEPPASPAHSVVSWMRNPLRSGKKANGNAGGVGQVQISSPGMESIASFDSNVMDVEKEKRQAEMDRLYAAVMLHDAARRSQTSATARSDADAISYMPRSPHYRPSQERLFSDRSLQRLPRPQEDFRRPNLASERGISQRAKVPIRAIYPPSYDNSHQTPLSPTSPVQATVPDSFWPQRGRQPLQINSKRQQQQPTATVEAAPMSPQLPLSPTTPRIELPNDMYPASPPPGGRRMRLPTHVGQAFPLSPGPITPISPAPMTAALQIPNMGMVTEEPTSPRYQLQNDMYPASPPLQSHPMTFAPPPLYTEKPPARRPSPARSFSSRMETESITSNKSSRSRRMKNMRIITPTSKFAGDSDDRAPLSATFRKDIDDANKETSDSNTPDTPKASDFAEARIDAMSSTLPSLPHTRLGTPPRRPAHRMHSRGPSAASINSNFGRDTVPASPALSHVSQRSIGLPSGPKSGVLPGMAITSHPRPSAIKLPPPHPQPSASSAATPTARSPAPANAPGGSKPLALRVQFGDDNNLLSPAPVKTTFLERRTAALRGAKTPVTGLMPQTPYSAYMPFTPVTPITPHLVTRQERRQRKREMGKSVLQDADMVREEDEEWD